MRCQMVLSDGTRCSNLPADGRFIPIRHGDGVEVLLCDSHRQLFDIYTQANKEQLDGRLR